MVGEAIIAASASRKIYGTTRDPLRMLVLAQLNIEPIVMPVPSEEIIAHVAKGAQVVVSFPPDGTTDAVLAPACAEAESIVYVSSTGVYGDYRGVVTEQTPVDASNGAHKSRLNAEEIWRDQGAVVLRAPGIYGPKYGLHKRLFEGSYKLPGDGSGITSRIHVEDLAQIILAALNSNKRAETYVVGDQKPASQKEVVTWLCEKMNVPFPESAPLEEVSPTLRGSRSVDGGKTIQDFGIKLKYPTYEEGFDDSIKRFFAAKQDEKIVGAG
jgi:nucleoside-diphosphate-sugar epimerase